VAGAWATAIALIDKSMVAKRIMESMLPQTSAVEQARLIRAKEVSARELVAAHLKQIERLNPKVNAIVTLVPELAMEAAARADEMQARGEELGPLHGLPVAHKDLLETRGIRTTFGSPIYRDYIPAEDHPEVARLRGAGAITIGKTNTPEFGAGSQTFNTIFGATYNPYDLTKTCGGSSGGAAVALACGLVPIATGTDLGGSLRNPAAFCNVVGFRPSIDPGADLNTTGCLGRSVGDLALALLETRPLDRDFRGVHIAWYKDLGGVAFDPRVRAVVDAHRAMFESLGCIVEEDEPDFARAETAFRILRAWRAANNLGDLLRRHPDAFKDVLKAEIETGLRMSLEDVTRGEIARGHLRYTFQRFLDRYEYFVLPTTQVPPFDVRTPYPTEIAGVKLANYIDWMKSCWYISMTGHPAISVPAGFTPEGLPVGLQIVGRSGQDFSVLQLAHAFEQAKRRDGIPPQVSNLPHMAE
jgi:amidase